MWVIVAAVLVMFMQAGFLLLEVGFSRAKNVGRRAWPRSWSTSRSPRSVTGRSASRSPSAGSARSPGTHGFFLDVGSSIEEAGKSIPFVETYSISPAAFMFFQFVFCAVSLAIVWGTTLERIKFGAYIIYAVIFSSVLYPVISHWIFGGGWLQVNIGMQDFAGSTVVHLIGATGALAALLLLGPRIGKYTKDGKPRAIPGHSMPLVGLGVLILWLGWFGFNPGSTLGAIGGRFAEVVVVTNLAAAAGVVAAVTVMYLKTQNDRHRHGRQRRDRRSGRDHRPLRLRRVLGGADHRRCRRGHRRARRAGDREGASTTRSAPSRPTAWPVSGARCPAGSSPRPAWRNSTKSAIRASGTAARSASSARRRSACAVAFACVFVVSYAVFFMIKKTIGLRVSAGGRGRRARHLRARHVRVPGAVHPPAGVLDGTARGRRAATGRGARRHRLSAR